MDQETDKNNNAPMRDRMEELKQYWFVIRELTGREIKRKYARSYLGILWSVLSPLLFMLVMTLIFSTMFKRNIQNFPLYYLTGYLFYNMYGQTSQNVMTVLVDNRNMLFRVKVPKNVFVLSRCYTALISFLYSMLAYLPLLFISGVKLNISMLFFPIDILFCLLFGLGVGYVLSILYVFFADIKYLYTVFMTILMYLSALFYPIEQVPQAMQLVIYNNPVYDYMLFARDCMVYGKIPSIDIWIRVIVWGIASYFLGYLIFLRHENDVMQHL